MKQMGVCVHVGGELQLFLIRNEKPRIFEKEEKIDKQDIKRTDNERSR